MTRIRILVILIAVCCTWAGPVYAHNPFTAPPEARHSAPEPLLKSPLFVKLIVWQQQLRQHMSELIRAARNEGRAGPLLLLIGIALLYGMVHAAGPGHGKGFAASYVLSHRATLTGGLLFGICFAVVHVLSGVIGVVGLHAVIARSVSETLTSVTTITQIISFGLITLLGLGIVVHHGRGLVRRPGPGTQASPVSARRSAILTWATTVGLIPCPAVVMVMLFCLSMNALLLGLVLSLCICIGMATTISCVVIAVVMGKSGMLRVVAQRHLRLVEGLVGMLAGMAIVVFGTLFLLAAVNAACA